MKPTLLIVYVADRAGWGQVVPVLSVVGSAYRAEAARGGIACGVVPRQLE